MDWLCGFVGSSVGKKAQVAVAGLLLCLFLVSHLAGNALLWLGPEIFNHYGEALVKNPVLPLAEAALAALFLLHAAVALRVRYQNCQARPVPYQRAQWAGGRTFGSWSMAGSGLLLLAFLIVHVKTFRFADHGGDLHRFVLGKFRSAPYAAFYLAAMGALALHLSHGFQSGFRTLGLEHPKYTPLIVGGGLAFAGVIAGGFAVLVFWAGWLAGGN